MKKVNPRRGSMQFWPRVRAKKETARIKSWADEKEARLKGFAGYKAGMTHIIYTDNSKTSMTKGAEVSAPVTVIECPPIKIASARFYKKTDNGSKVVSEVLSQKLDKELSKLIAMPKSPKKKLDEVTDFDFVHALVYTQPKMTSIKKKPELFEIPIGGKKEDQLSFLKDNLGKEVKVSDVFKEGELLDIHSITTGKGFQGPVKRFGVKIRESKSEKVVRGPGSLGPWKAQGHVMYRNPLAGKMGYHTRTEYNKWLMKISDDVKGVNPKGGFIRYGDVNNTYILVKGSIGGPKKRLIRLAHATRPTKNVPSQAPSIEHVSLESKQ